MANLIFGIIMMVIGAFFFVAGAYNIGNKDSDKPHTTMPPGYELLSNGNGLYKWRGDGYSQSVGGTKEDAFKYAWISYNSTEFFVVVEGPKQEETK